MTSPKAESRPGGRPAPLSGWLATQALPQPPANEALHGANCRG
eukprot:CAMPEP_0172698180 /NCGR_PEP_ID=MMETSP1074-20121228/29287_1 /TAXON_ID=2916 /ORGANISM="Ceratium fusus, Strain PA161109" /LENGTH=42 /DNA_ID= /DNA_START= /DNA_END= /DNA_ORIENTATION=